MSIHHLRDLRNLLESHHWVVAAELPGDDYRVSGVWRITRPDGTNPLHIEFEGLDDMETLPIEKAYACEIAELPEVSLYFGRVGRSWPADVRSFIEQLEAATTQASSGNTGAT